jgi:UDP-N-acetylglucosamine:LPS N-acetylglucosamine transferase
LLWVRDIVAGEYASAFRGRGVEFAEVREYQPGDDIRSIDWNVTARLGTAYVKRHLEERELTVMFAVGGSGVHTSLAEKILKGLRRQLREGSVNIILAAGTSEGTAAEFMKYVDSIGLAARLDRNVRVVYSPSFTEYFRQFNRALRVTDVLWTKPSELSFYCALGLPLVTAPAVGYHEELNRRWLQDMHAGIRPAGRAEDAGEWLLDLRDSGMLAEAAWEGFLKGRKMGAYKIEELLAKGSFTTAPSPLER